MLHLVFAFLNYMAFVVAKVLLLSHIDLPWQLLFAIWQRKHSPTNIEKMLENNKSLYHKKHGLNFDNVSTHYYTYKSLYFYYSGNPSSCEIYFSEAALNLSGKLNRLFMIQSSGHQSLTQPDKLTRARRLFTSCLLSDKVINHTVLYSMPFIFDQHVPWLLSKESKLSQKGDASFLSEIMMSQARK